MSPSQIYQLAQLATLANDHNEKARQCHQMLDGGHLKLSGVAIITSRIDTLTSQRDACLASCKSLLEFL